jgi:hypothetical protein
MMRQHSSHLAPQDELGMLLVNEVTKIRRPSFLTTRNAPLAGARGLLCFAHSDMQKQEVAPC